MNRALEAMGAKIVKRYRVYERVLEPGTGTASEDSGRAHGAKYRSAHAGRPGILARGPWEPDQVEATGARMSSSRRLALTEAADVALDGSAARIALPRRPGRPAGRLPNRGWRASARAPAARWALRLVRTTRRGASSVAAWSGRLDGSWLAGRRAAWLASWAGTLGPRGRRFGGGRREPGSTPAPRAARGMVGRSGSGCGSRRWFELPSEMVLLRRPGLAG